MLKSTDFSKIYCFSSIDRDLKKYPNAADYILNLPETINNISKIELVSIDFDNNFYNVNLSNNKLYIEINDNHYHIEFTTGYYDSGESLVSMINECLFNTLSNNDIRVKYIPIKKSIKFQIIGDYIISFKIFNKKINLNNNLLGYQSEISNYVGKREIENISGNNYLLKINKSDQTNISDIFICIIGLNKYDFLITKKSIETEKLIYYEGKFINQKTPLINNKDFIEIYKSNLTLPNMINLNNPNFIMLNIPNLDRYTSINNYFAKSFAIIPVNSIINYNREKDIHKIFQPYLQNISKFEIKFMIYNHNQNCLNNPILVDFNGIEHFMKLRLTYHNI